MFAEVVVYTIVDMLFFTFLQKLGTICQRYVQQKAMNAQVGLTI